MPPLHDRKIEGEPFVRKLKVQEIRLHTVSSAALPDLIAAGELAASPHIFRDHAVVSKDKGSTVEWLPMELVPTTAGAVSPCGTTGPSSRRGTFR